jgi:hypothetical protein
MLTRPIKPVIKQWVASLLEPPVCDFHCDYSVTNPNSNDFSNLDVTVKNLEVSSVFGELEAMKKRSNYNQVGTHSTQEWHFQGVGTKKAPKIRGFQCLFGEPRWGRTNDHLIKSQGVM